MTTFGQDVYAALARRQIAVSKFAAAVGVSYVHLRNVLGGKAMASQALHARMLQELEKIQAEQSVAAGS